MFPRDSTPKGRPLRVALLAPPALPVPPDGYGGTERVVHTLALGLEREGCDVIVVAAGTMLESFPEPVGLDLPRPEASACDLAHAACLVAAARRGTLGSLDLIHDHTKVAGCLVARWSPVPVLTTVHNDRSPGRALAYGAVRNHPFVFLSRAHARRFPEIPRPRVVHNGLDLSGIPFRARGKGDYVLFLGRFSRVKGPGEAIAAARLAGLPIILAGPMDPSDPACFQEDVAPRIDGRAVRFAGTVNGSRKWDLLGRARALLAPVSWEEPFGLTAIEAMACGTPVVAYARGALPEIVAHGRTGFLVPERGEGGGPEGLAAALASAARLDPYECRAWVAEHFSAEAMARSYLALYRDLLAGRRSSTPAAIGLPDGPRGDAIGGIG